MSDQDADIPSSCLNMCCTTCAFVLKITSGEVDQSEALGLPKEKRDQDYALLFVSYPKSDIECVLQDEDDVNVKQFRSSFESSGVE